MRALTKQIRAGLLAAALAAPVAVYAQVTYPFDLPAQALADSLRAFGSQARINVIFDPAAVRDRNVPALKGSYTSKQALAKLLEGTGYTAEFTDATTVVIKPQGPKPTPDKTRRADDKPVELPEAQSSSTSSKLDTVTVLGSLIPRAQVETASMLITITAEDIKNRGFSSVADALQNATVNTGAINNTAINTGDIWAAKTLSLFGLDPSYTKFLVDGRPMPLFSQIAQTTSVDQLYTNLTGIPIDLVDRIEILPGGQSSLYGSDAVAAVVNIVLKKHVDFGSVNARLGSYPSGGGRERLLSASESFQVGKLDLMLNAQIGDQEPMWAFQRRITAQNFAGGVNPQQPNADVFALGLFTGTTYFPQKPADCAKLSGLWGGSEGYHKDSSGTYCGSVSSGAYTTMINKDKSASASAHLTYALNDRVQLYTDLFDSYEEQAHPLSSFFTPFYWDSNLQDLMFVWKSFAPEEMANNLDGLLNQKNYENTYTATFGAKADVGGGWVLDAAVTRSGESSNNRQTVLWSSRRPDSFGAAFLGPQLGTMYGYPVYNPNYGLLSNPVTPSEFAKYVGSASIASASRNDQLRAQATQSSLFTLPGGDAGLALVAETGYESWNYRPAALLKSGDLLGQTWNPGGGDRDRYATAAELNLPVFKMFTADLAARYDSYDAQGAKFSHPTYSLGLEFRPVDGLLLRGKYSTSFKAPSLIDQFEGGNVRQSTAWDYLNCARLGYTGANVNKCPVKYLQVPITLTEVSNPHLDPLTAKTFSYGAVWSPTSNLSMSVDYQHIAIKDEVLKENTDYLLQNELYCENGTLDPQSPSCTAARAQIMRAPATPGSPLAGRLLGVTTTKINIAQEVNNSINASFNYKLDIGWYGRLAFDLAYTRVLTHRHQTFPGDPELDFLNRPHYSTEFRTKGNLGLTWSRGQWNATLFGTYYGPTPNYIAYRNDSYDVPLAGKVAAWRIWNASVNYSPTQAWRLSLRMNNLMNSMPPIDVTYPSTFNQPFNAGNYNPYGREIFVEARYQFGHAKQ
ncbi:TonB-dependent receptor [Rudaea sp.]|uniref:TonB-dependent receptor n=1 Tax=Rudaea sp. TaxID=2136325 RepID=UPI002ECFF635